MSGYDYRPFLPSPEASKIAGPTARAHAEARLKSPRAQGLFANWERLFSEPFVGITTAGTAIPDIYKVQPEGAPTRAMIEAVNALLVEQLLARWSDVKVVLAADGRAGLAQARTVRPDLVLLDLQLPDIDGVELLGVLRAEPAMAGVPVVVLTADAMPEDVARARAAGAADYWTKPLDFQRALADIAELLHARRR